MHNNNNTGVLINNNNNVRPQDLILFFKIPTGTRNNFLDTYRQFEHAPSKGIVSPDMKYIVLSVAGCTLNAHKPNEEIRKLNICNENVITVG
jgi:hypothetical protein